MPKIHRDRPATDAINAPPEPSVVIVSDLPARSAVKAKWVAYAKAVGIDSAGTKAQIIARVDG